MNTRDILVFKANIPLKNGESIGQYTREISKEGEGYLLKKLKLSSDKGDYVYSVSVFSSKVIFSVWKRKDKGSKYYSLNYKRNTDGNFDFSDMQEVELKQSYEVKKNQEIEYEDFVLKATGDWIDVSKPYPNEHAARQTNPNYEKYARAHPKGFPTGVDVIYGIKTVQGKRKSEIQSIRFKANLWTPEKARKWLKDHNFKTNLEVASKPKEVKKSLEFNDVWEVKKQENIWDGLGVF